MKMTVYPLLQNASSSFFLSKKQTARLCIDGMHLHIDHVQRQVSSVCSNVIKSKF
jgi:hypothetical protein